MRWCVLLLLLVPSGGWAYTLEEAFADALAKDARIQAAAGRIAQAREQLDEARSGKRPVLSLTGSAGYSYNRNQARAISIYEGESARGGVQVNQRLSGLGRVSARIRQAEAGVSEAEEAAHEVRQEVLAEVARAFAEQIFLGRILERRRAFEGLVEVLVQSARERIEQGTLDRTELHRVLLRLHRARAERVETDAQHQVARQRLARLTGGERREPAAESLAGLELALPETLEAALSQAESNSPVLAQERLRLEEAQAELDFREAELLPDVGLEFSAGYGRTAEIRSFEYSGGLNLSVPLYEGGVRRSRVRNAGFGVDAARQDLAAELERVGIEVRSSWDLMMGLEAALEDFRAAMTDGDTLVELTGSKLAAGRATLVQQVEARQAMLDTELDLLESRLRIVVARINLLRTLAGLGL